MSERGSASIRRLLALAATLAGIPASGGGCLSPYGAGRGLSLDDVASGSRRPAVTASYEVDPADETEKTASSKTSKEPGPRETVVVEIPTTAQAAGEAPAPDDGQFARFLAELQPEEADAFRRMLAALRQAPASVEPTPSNSGPIAATQAAAPIPQGDRLASRTDVVAPRIDRSTYLPAFDPPATPIVTSPFVAKSLEAFTSIGAPAAASPLADVLAVRPPHFAILPTNEPKSVSPSSEIALAAATSDVDANEPPTPSATTTSAPDWQAKLSEASRGLAAALDKPNLSDKDRKTLEAKLRLLHAIEHRFGDALVPVSGSPEEQGFWKELCGALQELFDPQATPYDDKRATLALRRLDDAARQLSRSADLDIARLAFCTAVETFGQYDEFPRYEFSADQEALLYVEVRRFAAEPVQQPFAGYRTALEGSYRIVEVGTGRRLAEHVFPVAEEVSRSPRSDFFIAYRVYLPKTMPPGKYRLEFNLRDQVGDKHGMGWLDFAVTK